MARRVDGRRPPQNDAEWARQQDRRVTALETGQSSQRIGSWVISDVGGELIATNDAGRLVNITSTLSATADTSTATAVNTVQIGNFTLKVVDNGYTTGDLVAVDRSGAQTTVVPGAHY